MIRIATRKVVALAALLLTLCLCLSPVYAVQGGAGEATIEAAQVRRRSTPSHLQRHRSLSSRDASTLIGGGKNNEGAAHGPIKAPSGSNFVDLPVGTRGDLIGTYWTANPQNSSATHAFVMIHGKLRDGDKYWSIMNTALDSAVKEKVANADAHSIVVAPEFFSAVLNSGEYTSHELAWADVNAWQAGELATHPSGTQSSAFEVLDAFVAEFADKSKYPVMTNVTLVGHGGGAQLMQRYAVVGRDAPDGIHVRYVYGDPSSCVYFTTDRPQVDPSLATIETCQYYNTWRYGFDNYTQDVGLSTSATPAKQPIDFFAQYIKRDVVSLIGLQDVDASGDEFCMAQLQGGAKRRDRNLAYWKYINTLARTDSDMTGFNATFSAPLPDWSNVSRNAIAHRLIIIADADHNPALVFGSSVGRAALFDSDALPTGWRPPGWSANGNRQSSAGGSASEAQAQAASGTTSSSSKSTACVRTLAIAVIAASVGGAILLV
ncbi:hypothetical protein K437DRAFT_47586 [Tilletiaria anomala UBC 951]|uniref:Transmembrane protein n=1 Tax=Tilletiaria anomala (strain ATCC 24038 / CBS 436.72 / UBC 951) TaxID=1037660 RepID=A0A066V692_TILAU|nr:uncharacterized protein K437DRAFT_47586 [Tilletiaria anomala UBC 951]KDN36981.1 hypothetical protein K437DRAFT_47586 [Tilletiaria anomala UBC 951]